MGAGVAGICVLGWLTALSFYDIRERRLPNWLTIPGAAVILVTAAAYERGTCALLGALALFAMYTLVHLISPTAMGGGDVKLAIGIGALTASFGSDVWLLAALGAPLLSAGWAVVVVVRRADMSVPYGPPMCVSAAAATALAWL